MPEYLKLIFKLIIIWKIENVSFFGTILLLLQFSRNFSFLLIPVLFPFGFYFPVTSYRWNILYARFSSNLMFFHSKCFRRYFMRKQKVLLSNAGASNNNPDKFTEFFCSSHTLTPLQSECSQKIIEWRKSQRQVTLLFWMSFRVCFSSSSPSQKIILIFCFDWSMMSFH